VSRNKAKGEGAAKKSGKDSKKKKSLKKSTTKKPSTRKPTEKLAKEPAKKNEENDAKKPVDMVQARENISVLVRESAAKIATGVIEVAKSGQLASARYLFEAVGLYPATEQTPEKPAEDSLAHTLLRRMGLPLEPVVTDDDDVARELVSDARRIDDESVEPER
jgi:Tfp pilus assembly protein PilF